MKNIEFFIKNEKSLELIDFLLTLVSNRITVIFITVD